MNIDKEQKQEQEIKTTETTETKEIEKVVETQKPEFDLKKYQALEEKVKELELEKQARINLEENEKLEKILKQNDLGIKKAGINRFVKEFREQLINKEGNELAETIKKIKNDKNNLIYFDGEAVNLKDDFTNNSNTTTTTKKFIPGTTIPIR